MSTKKISAQQFGAKFRNKSEMEVFMRTELGCYMPDAESCTMYWWKDILSGKKLVSAEPNPSLTERTSTLPHLTFSLWKLFALWVFVSCSFLTFRSSKVQKSRTSTYPGTSAWPLTSSSTVAKRTQRSWSGYRCWRRSSVCPDRTSSTFCFRLRSRPSRTGSIASSRSMMSNVQRSRTWRSS